MSANNMTDNLVVKLGTKAPAAISLRNILMPVNNMADGQCPHGIISKLLGKPHMSAQNVANDDLGHLLLTRINFNPSMDK